MARFNMKISGDVTDEGVDALREVTVDIVRNVRRKDGRVDVAYFNAQEIHNLEAAQADSDNTGFTSPGMVKELYDEVSRVNAKLDEVSAANLANVAALAGVTAERDAARTENAELRKRLSDAPKA